MCVIKFIRVCFVLTISNTPFLCRLRRHQSIYISVDWIIFGASVSKSDVKQANLMTLVVVFSPSRETLGTYLKMSHGNTHAHSSQFTNYSLLDAA